MNTTNAWAERVAGADWAALTDEVNDYGCALMPPLLTSNECTRLAALYDETERFRSTVDMARYRFGKGEYRYFDRPLPDAVESLKQSLYPRLLPIARDWWTKLGRDSDPSVHWDGGWPDTLDKWLAICHQAGQTKSTPDPAQVRPRGLERLAP